MKSKDLISIPSIFSKFLGEKFSSLNHPLFDDKIPRPLQQLYSIEEQLGDRAEIERGRLFALQDQLVPRADLKLNEELFEFLNENQFNWTLKCNRGWEKEQVYRDDELLPEATLSETVLIFALQELIFYMDHGFEPGDLEPIKRSSFKLEPLILNRRYVMEDVLYSFWLVEDSGLLMESDGIGMFSTQNQELVDRLKSL